MSRGNKDGYIGMSAVERRLIELIRKSEKARQIAETFIFGPQKSPTDLQAPFDAQGTSS